MGSQAVSPFVAGHVIPPLLRPLPILFAYGHACADNPSIANSSLNEDFSSHLNCFVAMVEAAGDAADIPRTEYRTVIQKAKNLAAADPRKIVDKIDELDLELAHFSEVHKSTLRQAYNMKPELFKEVYRQHVKARQLILAYQVGSTEGVPKLQETLSERCYYKVKSVDEGYLRSSLRKANFVLFTPTQEPISSHAIDSVREQRVPFLVLVNLGTDLQGADIVQTRLASLYQRNGMPILHRPFPAIRLFQRIDREIVENQVKTLLAPKAAAKQTAEA